MCGVVTPGEERKQKMLSPSPAQCRDIVIINQSDLSPHQPPDALLTPYLTR